MEFVKPVPAATTEISLFCAEGNFRNHRVSKKPSISYVSRQRTFSHPLESAGNDSKVAVPFKVAVPRRAVSLDKESKMSPVIAVEMKQMDALEVSPPLSPVDRNYADQWRQFLVRVAQNGPVEDYIGPFGSILKANDKDLYKHYYHLIRKGIPQELRPMIWTMGCAITPGELNNLLVNENFSEETQNEAQIKLDARRTMRKDGHFHDSNGVAMNSLIKILVAISRKNPDIGYCQGMNLVAANCLLVIGDMSNAFSVMEVLVSKILNKDFFKAPFKAVQTRAAITVHVFMRRLIPALYYHLSSKVDLTPVLCQWFLSLFSDIMPSSHVRVTWDQLFGLDGELALITTSLAILKWNEKSLLSLKSEGDIYEFLFSLDLSSISCVNLLHHIQRFSTRVTQHEFIRLVEKYE